MYEYIKGKVVGIKEDCIILENNGIGYRIYTSNYSISNIDRLEGIVKIYTSLFIREDEIFIYGFVTEEELSIFNSLLLVSKVGPKLALSILSSLKPMDVKLAILSGDVDCLCKAPGVGKKTANRIILELRDRIDDNIDVDEDINNLNKDTNLEESIKALISLGYTRKEVWSVLNNIDCTDLSTEDIIKLTLKQLSRN